VETETSGGIIPFHYKRNNAVNATQWSIGLELALLVDGPWKMFLTTDHPNGGPFTSYPRIISWLMSKKARKTIMEKMPRGVRRRTCLESIDRELSFPEIAVMTRAGTAKALGLKHKGHLAVGADADIAVYPADPKRIDPSSDYKELVKAFRNASYVLKEGEIVVHKGNVVKSTSGRTFWVNTRAKEDLLSTILPELETKFAEYYTVRMENYLVREEYLGRSAPIHTVL
jgi:formylmethanofuran dehydrogenase subunit A